MDTKTKVIIGGVIVVIVAFFGGYKYGEAKTPSAAARGAGAYGAGIAAGRGGARGGAAVGGFTTGSILSKDADSITVSLASGGSKIVFVGTSTPVMTSASGSLGDLTVGQNVMVSGTANSDGSVNATSIQVRPARPAGASNQ